MSDEQGTTGSTEARGEYLGELRAKLRHLDDNLTELEERAREVHSDAVAYARYQEQFERVRRRRAEMDAALGEAESTAGEALDWADLKTRLDLVWRDLKAEAESARTGFDPSDPPGH